VTHFPRGDPPPGDYDDTVVIENVPYEIAMKVVERVGQLSREGLETAAAADRYIRSIQRS
jgi:hypothetical protein